MATSRTCPLCQRELIEEDGVIHCIPNCDLKACDGTWAGRQQHPMKKCGPNCPNPTSAPLDISMSIDWEKINGSRRVVIELAAVDAGIDGWDAAYNQFVIKLVELVGNLVG